MLKVAVSLVVVAITAASPAFASERPKIDTVALAASAASGTSVALPTSATPAPVSARQRYCIREVPTGSHIERTTCKTRSQWMEEEGLDPIAK
jgi:hypothetical protein